MDRVRVFVLDKLDLNPLCTAPLWQMPPQENSAMGHHHQTPLDALKPASRRVQTYRALILIVAGLGLLGAAGGLVVEESTNRTINAQRLTAANSEPGVWMSHGRTYDEQRHSPLSQIDGQTVSKLGLAWSYDTGRTRGHEATPLVANGMMYITTSWSAVHALDARTGELVWIYDPKVPRSWGRKACCDVVNRGVALWDDHVFLGSLDGRLIKLNAASGELVWDINTIDRSMPYTITGAPRVVKGRVIIGNGGAEYSARGYVSAYSAETGDLDWRFYTVPGDPSKPFEHPELEAAAKTWTGEWWTMGGGGTVWDSMAYDPALDLLYVGTGNGTPWARRHRSPDGGDNLFLSSILALDPDDGSLEWYYQTTPGDTWDYTATQHIVLADLPIDGKVRKVLMQAPKNGFFYVLDRATGELLSAEKFGKATWATHVDMATGRPVENPETNFDEKAQVVFPGPGGVHNWHPMSFHPGTGLVYIPARERASVYKVAENFVFATGDVWNTGLARADMNVMQLRAELAEPTGKLQAWNPVTQTETWSAPHPRGMGGGVLSTRGDLVFQGDTSGRFVAYAAESGEILWQVDTKIGIVAAPITFELDKEQYVTVLAGWGSPGDALRLGAAQNSNPGRLFTFKLNADLKIPTVERRQARKQGPIPQQFASTNQIREGQVLYLEHCVVCHGGVAGYGGGLATDLRFSTNTVHDNWEVIVRGGRFESRGMASFADVLDQTQAEAIRGFVVSLAQDRPSN